MSETENNDKKGFKINIYWIYGIVAVLLLALNFSNFSNQLEETDFNTFKNNMLLNKEVKQILIVNNEIVEIFLKEEVLEFEKYKDIAKDAFGNINKGPHYYFTIGSVEFFQSSLAEAQKDFTENEKVIIRFEKRKDWFSDGIAWLLPFIIIIAFWIFMMRRMAGGGAGGQMFNVGKAKPQLYDTKNKIKVSFKDVAGLNEAKAELEEVVDMLKNPKKYEELGAEIPKGTLLTGPPGTGKTLMAKAMAGEANVPFFSISGADFVEMFVGVGASRVRDLFKTAKEKAPCIIFIDEIEAIGRKRGKGNFGQANDERENTLNQLLVEMDGFNPRETVIILAATNRPDLLDSALLRPGRFDRQIFIDVPDKQGRQDIFKVHLKKKKLADDIDIEKLADLTIGFSGADIANSCNEAALTAARHKADKINMEHFNIAIDRIVGGLEKKSKVILPDEKKRIAYHEAGHAVCGWYLEHASPLLKVSIVPRGKAALGYAQYLPKEQYLQTSEQLKDMISMTLGGRAAEEIIFGDVSTGAQNDLEKITNIIYSMITIFGMNKKIGQFSYKKEEGDFNMTKLYSEETAKMIDGEAREFLEVIYQETLNLLKARSKELELLAQELLKKEVVNYEDIEALIGKREFGKR